MTEAQPSTINPFLNPAYWEGHYIGDNDAAEQQQPRAQDYRSYNAALDVLGSHLRSGGNKMTIRSFPQGNEFNANDYDPSTIFLIGHEMLTNVVKNTAGSHDRILGRFVPGPPGLYPELIDITDKGYSYNNIPDWGVIAQTRKDRAVLYVANTATTQGSMRQLESNLIPGPTVFKIGKSRSQTVR
ncbi:MAG TPA: hypothetical protein VJ836_07835 [Candidatus Saccharimonadales bacterium]|nr:hypothetical protein [Candidatus Saccharimonadales bacterium]